ncbi:FlgB family protein [Puniceibacterium sp. IMCC21224]|uniref:FlgB family protein n=1 Tax=Puniceibacterium sp. IMCC21224 TaxID=1618204 RepID=UPI00065D0EF8|nr:FlgB family protein [Puniceibacterium sp. IMCC21224]KMK65559.1 flagellar basal body protein [Puniceibacterium sp. IMCC21224]
MFQNLDIFKTAMALARHAGTRQAVSAQNIANADTPGYQARVVSDFAETVQAGKNRPGAGSLPLRATRSGHMLGQRTSDTATITESRSLVDPNGNGVALEEEMLVAVEAKRDHERALAIYRSNMTLLRTSLGRG